MNRLYIFLLVVSAGLCNYSNCPAQSKGAVRDFAPYENVLFYDDFSADEAGALPNKWEAPPDYQKQGWTIKVVEHPDGNFMAVSTPLYNNATLSIEPKMDDINYLTDSFTFDFECYLENGLSKVDVDFYASSKDDAFDLKFHTIIQRDKKGYVLEYAEWYRSVYKEDKKLPPGFLYNSWHHFAISYTGRMLKCYLDEERLLALPSQDPVLSGLFFSFTSAVDIKNVRITTGTKKAVQHTADRIAVIPVSTTPISVTLQPQNELNKLLTENKFVTHAINFDVNQSTIKPEGMEFISDLAAFLKANFTVRLEIDGHTDSDGDPVANVKLSQARADEVKKQLANMGINENRLTTKGFGASVPLKPNTTPENKAENRRVEFIKL